MDILFILFLVLAIVTVAGHLIWVILAKIGRWIFYDANENNKRPLITPSNPRLEQLNELDITERQITRFYSDGKLNDETYELLLKQIRAQRAGLAAPEPALTKAPALSFEPVVSSPTIVAPPSVVTPSPNEDEIIVGPVTSFRDAQEDEASPAYEKFMPPPRVPRRPFSEVLNSFMEESNIRWGEIIGGLLIIGCSTALVVSLWSQISRIPALKFSIFTTVTAVLFGIGLYTEHRWKLPTTSRGILTIATLLVPLNFLAIAAVSASQTSGGLVIATELAAPAIFFCLVYFAGRVITPGCAHILSAGVLGSSVGQLLVRHFASIDASPLLLIVLGAFPVTCYIVTVALALRLFIRDREIDENEITTIFTLLGTMSFAALLPLGLLLYKSGPLSRSMMYLAPLVTVWGLPLVATGTLLWKRIANKELIASRTAGTALGLLGLMIVVAGMVLAWPNPSSIVPAALLSFVTFTALAVVLELPVAHLIAAGCFALAYLVTFHVFAGNITWVNLRVMSLLKVSLSVSSGQGLAGAFALFLVASEWLSQRRRERDSYYYFVSAGAIAVLSLALATLFGVWSYYALWVLYGFYSLSALWIAWRRKLAPFTWIAAALLLFSLAHNFAHSLSFSFPWQTALLAHATLCAVGAIVSSRYKGGEVISIPLNYGALISIVLGIVSLFQANQWEVTWMQAQRVWWISGILVLLLWMNRRRTLLGAFQIASICALVLTVKATLQQYEWYSYFPHAFLHPAALQIQGTVLALFCLAWLAVRFLVQRAGVTWSTTEMSNQETEQVGKSGLPPPSALNKESWLTAAGRLLEARFAVDRVLVWFLLGGFLLFAGYGSLSGVTRELAAFGSTYSAFDVAGFSHREALGVGSWILLGLLLLAMLATFWERPKGIYLLGALTTLSAALPLLAGQFEDHAASATAWRWLAAMFFLGGSLLLWYRGEVSKRLAAFGWPSLDGNAEAFVSRARVLLIVLTVVPLVLFTLCALLQAVSYIAPQGPTGGIFASLNHRFSYGAPLVIVAVVMIGHALRDRVPEFAFYAGALLNLTVTVTFLLVVAAVGGLMDRVVLVRLVQLNAITFALYSLPWLSRRRHWYSFLSDGDQKLAHFLLNLQLILAVALNILLLLPITLNLLLDPVPVGVGTVAAGSFWGWLTLAATVVAAVWFATTRTIRVSAYSLAGLLVAVSCLLAISLAGWVGLHVLTVCTAASAWLIFSATEWSPDQTRPFPINLIRKFDLETSWASNCTALAVILGSGAVYLSLYTLTGTEMSRWWSIGPLLAITALAAALNWQTQWRGYLYLAGMLFYLTVSLWWIYLVDRAFYLGEFLWINLIAGSLAGVLWLRLELRARTKSGTELDARFSFHHLVAVLSLAMLAWIVLVSFIVPDPDSPILHNPVLSLSAFFSILVLMTACLWDRHAKYAVAGLYTLGLIAGAMVLHMLTLRRTDVPWAATIFLSAYTLFTALLWHKRAQLISFAEQIGISPRLRAEATELTWFSVFTTLAVAVTASLAFWVVLGHDAFGPRAEAALVLTAQFLTLSLLAEGRWAERWRLGALAVFVIGMVLFGWSWLTPGINATWLNRSVILMLEAFGLVAIYGLLLNKARAQFPQWTKSARACLPWLLGAGVVALFFCLQTEIFYQIEFGAVRIHPLALVAIGATLVAAIVICVLFALSPSHDPLSLSERGRMRYVYAAEVMLALLFLHIRLTLPWLFTGFIERYWPLAIMIIAYFGVVTSEALRRRNLMVLAQPLERTGAFLPLLPVLGFWLAASEVDFSLVLFIVGGLYGLLSILRRSFAFGLLAAVAGNAGLWYFFHRTEDYQFLQHPQLWLIPVALSVLLAAYLNDDKLSEDQMTGVRYLSLVTIYASSTADIFINGVANSPWLPLILASFSLAGVFAGIMFRIRGLLLLGAIFLLLSILTMIWYASVNLGWTWLWYVAGIVTGATIIFMFALFEKKRSEMLRLVEGLKDWER